MRWEGGGGGVHGRDEKITKQLAYKSRPLLPSRPLLQLTQSIINLSHSYGTSKAHLSLRLN